MPRPTRRLATGDLRARARKVPRRALRKALPVHRAPRVPLARTGATARRALSTPMRTATRPVVMPAAVAAAAAAAAVAVMPAAPATASGETESTSPARPILVSSVSSSVLSMTPRSSTRASTLRSTTISRSRRRATTSPSPFCPSPIRRWTTISCTTSS